MKFKNKKIAATAAILAMSITASIAGPFILAGTDADDHGSATVTENLNGWLFMQKALQNLAPGVTNGNKSIAVLGSSSTALSAAQSAFAFSGLGAAGWTLQVVDTAANLTNFFNGTAAYKLANAGILMMDSAFNVTGGADAAEVATFSTFSTDINNFLGAGGGLFSQSNGYAWVNALLPGLVVTNATNTGLTLTAAGTSAFPGLTNADLSAGPWHNGFTSVGSLPILAVGPGNENVILGAQGGSITNPGVPDSGSTIAMLGLALSGIAGLRRKLGV